MKCRSILSERNWSQLDNPDVLRMLMAKLPGYLQVRWNKQVFTIRQKLFREPKLTDLIDFVNEETVFANSGFQTLLSRHALVREYLRVKIIQKEVIKKGLNQEFPDCINR